MNLYVHSHTISFLPRSPAQLPLAARGSEGGCGRGRGGGAGAAARPAGGTATRTPRRRGATAPRCPPLARNAPLCYLLYEYILITDNNFIFIIIEKIDFSFIGESRYAHEIKISNDIFWGRGVYSEVCPDHPAPLFRPWSV